MKIFGDTSVSPTATGEGKYCTCLADLSGLTAAPAAECNSPCTGDHTGDMCGGADGMVTVASTAKSKPSKNY